MTSAVQPPSFPADTPATISLPPMPTPHLGTRGTFMCACSTRIAASPKTCFDITVDAGKYGEWNQMCRECVIESHPGGEQPSSSADGSHILRLGTKFNFHVFMDPETVGGSGIVQPMEVSVLEEFDDPAGPEGKRRKGWRVAWLTGGMMPHWVMRTERIQEFVGVPVEGGAPGEVDTEYYTYDVFYGPMAYVVKAMMGAKLVRGFNNAMGALKKRAEEMERKKREGASAAAE